jgi:hypothetical protein
MEKYTVTPVRDEDGELRWQVVFSDERGGYAVSGPRGAATSHVGELMATHQQVLAA